MQGGRKDRWLRPTERRSPVFSPGLEFLEVQMKSHLSRAVTAIGLGVSLWVTTVAALAAPPTQDRTKAQDQTQQAQKDTSKDKAPQPAPQASSNKPLSTGEDPTMIGKRNINKGIWTAGIIGAKGTEAEVCLGRQQAAKVAKEATCISKPITTENDNQV